MDLLTPTVAWYELNEASGDALDSHTGGHHGVETSGTIDSLTADSITGRDIEFFDTEYFQIAHHANLQIADTETTIAAFVRLESAGASRVIFTKNVSGVMEYSLYFDNPSNRFGWVVYDAATGAVATSVLANNFGAVPLNTWCLLVAKHDPDANQISLRVNNGTPNTEAHSGGVRTTSSAASIGATATPAGYWDGAIAKLGFFRTVTTDDEDTWLYNGGAGRSYADIVAASAAGQPTMRRWGGVPYVGGQGIGNKGLGRAFGYPIK